MAKSSNSKQSTSPPPAEEHDDVPRGNSRRPEAVFRVGYVSASVFVHDIETDDGKRAIRSVNIQKRYKDGDGEVKYTTSFGLAELPQSGFRVGDLMNFTWDDERAIHPVWPKRSGHHATVVIPSSQKNGRVQEIPLLPGLNAVLMSVPEVDRTGWIVNPQPMEYELPSHGEWFRPTDEDLSELIRSYSNRSIAAACGVSDMAVRKWLANAEFKRSAEFHRGTGEIPPDTIQQLRQRAVHPTGHTAQRKTERMTKERVSRVIALIGEEAKIIVRQENPTLGHRVKYASAHDLRRGCALRLINLGVSAETLKVVMRHADFATTEKYYGAMRSAQAAAAEVHSKLSAPSEKPSLVGGLVGGSKTAPQFSTEELSKLKALIDSL